MVDEDGYMINIASKPNASRVNKPYLARFWMRTISVILGVVSILRAAYLHQPRVIIMVIRVDTNITMVITVMWVKDQNISLTQQSYP